MALANPDQYTTITIGNFFQGTIQIPGRFAILFLQFKQVAGRVKTMHTHRGHALFRLTFDQGQMDIRVAQFTIAIQVKAAVFSLNTLLIDTLYRLLVGHAVMNQIGNRSDFQAMLFSKHFKIRTARHRAIFMDDFTNHRSWFQACSQGKITTCLSMPSTVQYTAWLRHQLEDMSWLYNIGRFGMSSPSSLNCMSTFSRRNTGRNTFSRFNRQGE